MGKGKYRIVLYIVYIYGDLHILLYFCAGGGYIKKKRAEKKKKKFGVTAAVFPMAVGVHAMCKSHKSWRTCNFISAYVEESTGGTYIYVFDCVISICPNI